MKNITTTIKDGKLEITKLVPEITEVSLESLMVERESIQQEKNKYIEMFDKQLAEKDFLIQEAINGGLNI